MVVLDTNIVIAAVRSPTDASAEILRCVLRGDIRISASVPLFLEYEAVLLRPDQLKAAKISSASACNLLDVLASVITPVEVFYLWRPQLKDVNDDMVLEAAMNGRAGAIVTFNGGDFLPAAERLGLRIIKPNEFLKELRDGHNQ